MPKGLHTLFCHFAIIWPRGSYTFMLARRPLRTLFFFFFFPNTNSHTVYLNFQISDHRHKLMLLVFIRQLWWPNVTITNNPCDYVTFTEPTTRNLSRYVHFFLYLWFIHSWQHMICSSCMNQCVVCNFYGHIFLVTSPSMHKTRHKFQLVTTDSLIATD